MDIHLPTYTTRMRNIIVGALLVGILNIIACESANYDNICGSMDCCLDGSSGGGYLKCGNGKFCSTFLI